MTVRPAAPPVRLVLLREEPGELGRGLAAAGLDVTHCPVTTTRPLPVAPEDVRGVALIALSSPRTLTVLQAEVIAAMRGVPTIAVGPVTAAAARDAALDVVAVGDNDARVLAELAPEPEGVPAGTPARPDATPAASPHVPAGTPTALAIGSAKARPTLAEGLTAKGWSVRVVPAYDTLPEPDAAPAVRATQAGTAVVATASSQVEAWFALDGRPDVRWIVIGEPTAATLRHHGAEPHLIPAHPHELLTTITHNLEMLR